MPLELGLPVAPHLPWIWHDKLVPTSRSSLLLFSAWNVLLFWFCTTASFSMRSQLKHDLEIPSLIISGAAPITLILTPIIVFQILVYCLLAYLSSSLFTTPHQNIKLVLWKYGPAYLLLSLVYSKFPKLLHGILANNFTPLRIKNGTNNIPMEPAS